MFGDAHGVKADILSQATLLDGIARHSPEGINFKQRAENFGWKQAVRERDQGSFDWTKNQPFKDEPSEGKS